LAPHPLHHPLSLHDALPILIQRLAEKNVTFRAKPTEQTGFWMIMLYQSLPFLLILGIAFFVMRQMQKNAGSGAMGFGKSRARMRSEEHTSELQSLRHLVCRL